MTYRLNEPGLNCGNCAQCLLKYGKQPRCRTPKGCPIEDIVSGPDSLRLEKQIGAFTEAKALGDASTTYGPVIERHLAQAGLFDVPATELIQMETVYLRWKNAKIEQSRKK